MSVDAEDSDMENVFFPYSDDTGESLLHISARIALESEEIVG